MILFIVLKVKSNLLTSAVLYRTSPVRLLPAALKLSSVILQMNILFQVCRFRWKERRWPEFSRNTVEEPQMEKLHVGLCRNSQRSWHTSTRMFASCSLSTDNSDNPLLYSWYYTQIQGTCNITVNTKDRFRCMVTVLQWLWVTFQQWISLKKAPNINQSIPSLNWQSMHCRR